MPGQPVRALRAPRFFPLTVSLLLLARTPAEGQEEGRRPPDPTPPAVEEVDDRRAAEILKESESKLRSKEPRIRAEGIAPFKRYRNESFVDPLAKLLKDRERSIVLEAIDALGSQTYPAATAALMRALQHKKYREDAEVMVPVLRALGKVGWGKKEFRVLRESFDEAPKEMRRALFEAFGNQQEKAAFSLFVDHLEAPAPENPHAPANQPASYWRERYVEWSFYRYQVAVGLEKLTGQKFERAEQAIAWAEEGPGKKLGFVYKKGD